MKKRWFAIAGVVLAVISSPRPTLAGSCDPAQLFDAQPAASGSGVTQVLTGRLDADTLTDLVVVYGATGALEVRRHVSGTLFVTTSAWTWTTPIQRALIADIDRDGKSDLVFTDDASQVVLYRGLGDGTFVLAKTITMPYPVFDLAAAEFGNGGSLEIVVSHPNSGRVSTCLSASGLDYTVVTTDISAQVPDPRWLGIGKLNNDTLWDVMVSRSASGRVYLLKGSGANSVGNGAFTVSSSLLAAGVATSLEIGDVDHDGAVDVVVGSNGRIEWVAGPGPTFDVGGSRNVTGGPVTDLLILDADGDGFSDILAARQSSSRVTTILGNGTRSLGDTGACATAVPPVSIAVTDLGGSSGPDLIIGGSSGMACLVSRCVPGVILPPPPPPLPPDSILFGPGPLPRATPGDGIEGPIPPVKSLAPPPPLPDPGPTPLVGAWPANGAVLCDAPGAQSQLVGTDDFAHGAYFAWIDERSGARDVYATRIGPDGHRAGGWTPNGTAICQAPGDQSGVSCITDGPWGVWVCWVDSRDGTPGVFLMKLLPDGNRAPGWPADGLRVCTSSDGQPVASVQAWADRFGGLILVWRQGGQTATVHLGADGLPKSPWSACGLVVGTDYMMSDRCSSYGGYLTSTAPHWPDGVLAGARQYGYRCFPEPGSGVCVGCATYNSTNLGVYDSPSTSHGIGSPSSYWIVYEYDDGGWYTIDIVAHVLHRYDFMDTEVWAASLGGDSQVTPGISGQLHLLQTTSVRRLDADGQPSSAFGPNGRPLCEACGPVWDMRQVDDGEGGVFVAWVDGRRDPNAQTLTDLYGTWYRTDGVRGTGWRSDGELLATSDTKEEIATIVGDRRGAAIVAWRDQRLGNWDLFAARLTSMALAIPNHGFTTPEAAISTDPRTELKLSGARPNPSSAGLAVQFSLSRAGDVTLRLIDVAGRELDRRSLRGLAAGGHTIALDARRAFPPGLYLLELDAEGRQLRSKVVITR